MTDLKVSIVLYKNEASQIEKAMSGILESGLDVRIVLIDNSPSDALRVLESTDDRIEYIFNDANIGFGAAHNIALFSSIDEAVKFHLVLNPDVFFGADVLPEILEYMLDNETVGNLMPNVLYADGKMQHLCKLLPNPCNLVSRLMLPKSLHRKFNFNRNFELRFWDHNHIANIPSLSGCFMFLRVDSLKAVGVFDETIFMYIEDLDLNRRIHQKYKTVFYPKKTIYHEHNRESFRKLGLLLIHLKSAIYYFSKWGWFIDTDRKLVNTAALDGVELTPTAIGD